MINLTPLEIFEYLGNNISIAFLIAGSFYILYKVISELFKNEG